MIFFKYLISLACLIFMLLPMSGVAQSNLEAPSLKELRVQYNTSYQLDQSYTIIYNNLEATAKLKTFKVDFYAPGRLKIGSTGVETFPLDGTIEGYVLDAPIVGFDEVQLVILSLYSGDIEQFPSRANSILALNELTEVPEVLESAEDDGMKDDGVNDVEPVRNNSPPIAGNGEEELEATSRSFSIALSELYSDPDGDSLTVSSRSNRTGGLPYQLDADGTLTIETASTVGTYSIPYEVSDIKGETASGTMALTVSFPDALRTQLGELSQTAYQARLKIAEQKKTATSSDPLTPFKPLEARLGLVESDLSDIATTAGAPGTNINAVKARLVEATKTLDVIQSDIADMRLTPAVETVEAPEGASVSPATATNEGSVIDPSSGTEPITETDGESGLPWWVAAAAVLLFLGVAWGLAGKSLGRTLLKNSIKPRVRPRHSKNAGVVFAASPMVVGNVAAPLSAAGQLTASQLQMLSGPYAVLREGYEATGRIGYAQEGVPSSEDFSFGTGFLVTRKHVVTNRHVHGLYGHYLTDSDDPGGIEFIAEKGKDASDFVPFNGQLPLLIPELDIAIFTLARAVTHRTPLAVKPSEGEQLDGQDIVVIGYPDTHTPEDPEIAAVVEEDPIFAVKRISQGQIFRHTTDTDTPYGVQTVVHEDSQTTFDMPAICHNASTLGGNSGSPLLDLHTGDLVGVHFAGFKIFNQQEAANLAMTIAQLAACGQVKNLKP